MQDVSVIDSGSTARVGKALDTDTRWSGPEYESTSAEDESTDDCTSNSHSEAGDREEDEDESPQARRQESPGAESGSEAAPCGADAPVVEARVATELRDAGDQEAAFAAELQRIGQEGLVTALARVFSQLAAQGRRVHRATVFHAASMPQISIQDYLARIAKYYHCSDGCLILGLIYIDRLVMLHPDFVVNGFNIHRLLSTSIMLAAKFHDDVFYSNKYYGKVAGVRVNELNRLEEKLLQLLNWRLCVLPREYEEYLGRVLNPAQAKAA